ncbi:MAG: DUF2799 domain-containing protein [Gammaproteobacteria bacterium]|nr:DUF2799 domain-containing protein [Gammaproteobacteria bacterium]
MKGLKIFVLLSASLLTHGCATLNENECKAANWKAIGFEDGSHGMDLARQFKRHRKACVEHGIKANFNQYKLGHKEGIRRYCVPVQGYKLGKSNRHFPGNCPTDLIAGVRRGYNLGHEIYLEKQSLKEEIRLLEEGLTFFREEKTKLLKERKEHAKYLAIADQGLANPASTNLEKVVFYTQRNEMEKLIAEKHDEIHAVEHSIDDREHSIKEIQDHIRSLDARPMPQF